jgi:pimeloyl-ACP methyl ester carboxylesterase
MCLRQLFCVAILSFVSVAATKPPRPQVAVPTTEPGIVAPPIDQTVPEPSLQQMYRNELGTAYDPVQSAQLHDAHQLLERYFQTHSADERKSIIGQLEVTQIDPNVLGRLCRIRSRWPALIGGEVYYVNQKSGAYNVRYFFGVPKTYDRGKPWPLVIRLPTTTAFLTTPPPSAAGVVQLYTGWIKTELAQHSDAIVLMPLLNLDEMYGPSYAGMNSVVLPLRDVADRTNIDPTRVYLIGHSLAAMGVWTIALNYPTYFAAINPLAGAADDDSLRIRLMNLRNTLPVVWHDEDDTVIKLGFSKSLVTAMQNMKVPVDFLQTKGIGHLPTEQILADAYQKLRKQTRNLYPPQVWLKTDRPDVLLNRNDWIQIDQAADPGKERHAYFRHTTGHATLYANSSSVKADIANNRITATSDNVDTLRFYVNDQMVNFSAPIQVIVNKKERFAAKIKPSIEQMLRDQLFLGRGWRYYAAAIEVELVEHPPVAPATRPTTAPSSKGKITVGPAAAEETK